MKAAELFVRCLENEGVEAIFGLPGEENIDIMDCLLDSKIRFITTRHEQAAAFMADVYGRLTGRAGVCLATLGPGATNLVTGVADANMDHAPVVAISGQSATTRMHKESHQYLDLVNLFRPISKYCIQVIEPETIPEVVRKAFKQAQAEKPGVSYIDLPENVAKMEVDGQGAAGGASPPCSRVAAAEADRRRRPRSSPRPSYPADPGRQRRDPRRRRRRSCVRFAEKLNIPVANTFMAKGVVPFSHPLWLGAVGLAGAATIVACGFDRADVIVCVGYDMVEYHPNRWNPDKDRQIVHIDVAPAEVDEYYIPDVEVVGDIGASLEAIAQRAQPQKHFPAALWQAIMDELSAYADDDSFPAEAAADRVGLAAGASPSRAIVVCDVGAHKMWMARMYQPERPNTCIISNGFAAMGIAVPGRHRRQAGLPRPHRGGRDRRRRLHDELPGDRNRPADRHADRDRDLERRRLRADRVAPVAALRPDQPRRLRQPRLREVCREFRGQGLPRRRGRRVDAHPQAGRSPTTRWWWSIARWTIRRT